ncbi:hypothetical protein [Candidatus Magnetobacterium casense]|uniref:Uncharacterized protein n=1 Tax=Candidatus Magnetobacterium casense TaxID=1455061 RepID=A0ABS6RVX8_9BACT|nr:hypothetical protein [Candidatus Magnetobacterium casensis]MBV6340179.1 hypothetical protein [Candidatus Magnetobacterium casensis]
MFDYGYNFFMLCLKQQEKGRLRGMKDLATAVRMGAWADKDEFNRFCEE